MSPPPIRPLKKYLEDELTEEKKKLKKNCENKNETSFAHYNA
jgi:hypothetical protein